MINLRQIQAFVAVAENKSFTNAAKLMYMTQPAVSAQIKALEERLEIKLIERTDKNVILTEAGELFYEEARRILALFNGFVEAVDELKGFRRGKLKIAASTIPGEYVLPKLLGGFGRIYPGIQLNLKIADTGKVVDQLIKGQADIGFIGAYIKNDHLHVDEFISDELIIIGAPHEAPAQITLDQLAGLKFILREADSGTRMEFHEHLKKLGIDADKLNVVMELGSTRAIITAVESGLGVSAVSAIAAEDALALGKVREIKVWDVCFNRRLYLAWNVNKYQNYAARAFLNYLKQADLDTGGTGS